MARLPRYGYQVKGGNVLLLMTAEQKKNPPLVDTGYGTKVPANQWTIPTVLGPREWAILSQINPQWHVQKRLPTNNHGAVIRSVT